MNPANTVDTHKLYLYCSVTNLMLIESGMVDGKSGYWFRQPVGSKHVFRSVQQINEELIRVSDPALLSTV